MNFPFAEVALGTTLLAYTLSQKPRLNSSGYLLRLLLPLYCLHQGEEHGYDVLGRRFAFRDYLCTRMGYGEDISACPATPAWFLAVNIGAVWTMTALAYRYAHKAPLRAVTANGIVFANTIIHIGSYLVSGEYNPGLVTAIIFFLPLSTWTFYRLNQEGILNIRQIAITAIIVGFGLHAVVFLSLFVLKNRIISVHNVCLFWYIAGLFPFPMASILEIYR